MRTNTKRASVILLLAMALPVLLMQGCGQPIAKDQGCPSDTYIANSTDLITGPPDTEFIGLSSFNNPYPGGFSINFTPVEFLVTDSAGVPRNNICIFAYTGDSSSGLGGPYWYTDETYATTIVGSGPFSARIIVTNDAGVAKVFWSTAVLPPANVKFIVPPSTAFKAGSDIKGTSFIKVSSGAVSGEFNVNWTVQGEPAS